MYSRYIFSAIMPDVPFYKYDGLPITTSPPPVHLLSLLPPLGLPISPHLLRTSYPPRSPKNRLVVGVVHDKLKLFASHAKPERS